MRGYWMQITIALASRLEEDGLSAVKGNARATAFMAGRPSGYLSRATSSLSYFMSLLGFCPTHTQSIVVLGSC
jgi:hypothetical protein